jgi:ABC-type branched-subunit amino acid transport system ATPase component/branched-subunit amino acid ABC-type transport system permease component
MSQLLQFMLLGLATGSLYALTAHGLVLVYRGSGVLNFAQGAFAMVGAYVYHRVGQEHGWSSPVRFAMALVVGSLLGVLTHLGLMRQLRRASPLVRLVATLGVMFLLLSIVVAAFGETARSVKSPLPSSIRHPLGAGVSIGEDRLWLIVIVLMLTAALSLAYRSTQFGRRTQAVAENPRAAAALGFSPDVIAAVNWGLGGALAAMAGVLLAPVLLLHPATLTFTVLRALAAALVGRFMSFWRTLAGALGIGVAEALLARFVAHEGLFRSVTSQDGLLFNVFSAQAVARSLAFLVIVVVMVVGGRALPMRGELLDRLPAVGTGSISWPLALGAVVVTTGVMTRLPGNWASALTISAATAIILLSIVVVTGFVGQVSLAQVALAGVGAWIAGRLAQAWGVPFPGAVVGGVVLTTLIGAVVAIPALRTRGMNLAVLTFGLSVCVFELVLANPSLTGGLTGTRVVGVALFGIDLDPFRHPNRYGVVVVLVLGGALIAVANLRRGPTGRRMIAVRGNERAAAALGVDVAATKLTAFAAGAAIAALGGILLAFRQHTIAYASFGTLASIQMVLLATIGGVGYVVGAVAGSLLAPGGVAARVSEQLGFGRDALDVVSGALLIVTLLANPNGMVHRPAQVLRTRRTRRSPSLAVRFDNLDTNRAVLRCRARSLRVDELTVRFGGVAAVDAVSLEIRPGEVLGIIGPNGAGKTTLLDAITGFVDVADGHVCVESVMIDGWPPHRRAQAGVGRSFQSLELFDDLTVAENLLVASENSRRFTALRDLMAPPAPALSDEARLAITDFGLWDALDRQPHELPYGTRRLVGIARAMAAGPSVLLLDEPAAGLSDSESAELGRRLRTAAARIGVAVALIEHDMELVMSTCDRVVVLDRGRKIAEGTPEEISTNPAVVSSYLGSAPARALVAGS